MTLVPLVSMSAGVPSATPTARRQSLVVCTLCGTRLRAEDDCDRSNLDADLFVTVARHRCTPRAAPRTR
jgi:hypothetical protein